MTYSIPTYVEDVYYTHGMKDKPISGNVIYLPSPGQRGFDEIIASHDPRDSMLIRSQEING